MEADLPRGLGVFDGPEEKIEECLLFFFRVAGGAIPGALSETVVKAVEGGRKMLKLFRRRLSLMMPGWWEE